MRFTIARTMLDRLVAEAADSPGSEVCGLLFGQGDRICDAIAARNVAADPARAFEIDPASLFAAIRADRNGGPRMIGHYHSHPSGLATPSACDAAAAGEQGRLWLILGAGGARLWRSVADGAVENAFEPVELIAD